MTLIELESEYERQCATVSDIYLHLPTFVKIVEGLDAKHVIELGTRTGVSTIAWLWGLAGTDGHLTSVDLGERPDIGDHDHWTYIQGNDLDPDVVGTLEPADIVFIDTSHLYAQTLAELNTYRWLVKPGGVILLHDTTLPMPEDADDFEEPFPVRRAIDDFCGMHGYTWLDDPRCWGLGMIRMEG